jgi:signal transduction histidine kinase
MNTTDSIWKKKFETLQQNVNNYKKQFDEVVDIAAHDLDAPLRKLSLLIERIYTKLPAGTAEELQPYIKRINSSVSDMRSIIDNLGMLSKVSDITATDIEECNLESIAHSISSTYSLDSIGTIKIGALPSVKGYPQQLELLFKEILENAIRFRKKNDPLSINISSAELSEQEKEIYNLPSDKKYYKIIIADNGIGFKQQDAEKIFRPFVRLHGKSEFEGNGIGLAVGKRIAGNHQGVLYAEGRENEGARFILIIPLIPG